MPSAMVVSIHEVLTYVILILLTESQNVISFPFFDCENLSPLIFCPDFGSGKWNERAYCQNCADGTKYHCCKDYYSPESNCEQDEYYCEEEKYVEGCAEEKFCKQGEEPVLDFIKNQIKSDKPEVFCEPCYNSNRYNSFKNTSSATYSECPRKKKNICTPASHKVECGKPSDETSERFCRCDVTNGYYPYSHADDHPSDGCSFDDYECSNDPPKCMHGQPLLLNYTCASHCKEGFYKNETSGDCIPNPTTLITTKSNAGLPSFSPTVLDIKTIISTQALTSTTVAHSLDEGVVIGLIVGTIVLVLIVLIVILCVLHKEKRLCDRCKCREQSDQSISDGQRMENIVQYSSGTPSDNDPGTYNFNREAPAQAHNANSAKQNSDAGAIVVNNYTTHHYHVQSMVKANKVKGVYMNHPEKDDHGENDENTSLTSSRRRASTSSSNNTQSEHASPITNLISNRKTKSTPDFIGKEVDKNSLPIETHSLDRRKKPCLQNEFGGSETEMERPKAASEARDNQQQKLEDEAKGYLRRLSDVADDFYGFLEEVDLVIKDIDKRFPQLLICPQKTVPKLECTEEDICPPDGFKAYKSSGNDNCCLYQSVSLLLRGDEQLQHRLRLKTALHSCKEFSRYFKLLEIHFQNEQVDTVKTCFYNFVSAETEELISEMTEKVTIINESLKALIAETAYIGKDSSRLHVQFLSDVLGMKIEQHFQLEYHFGGDSIPAIPDLENVTGTETLHVFWIDITGKGRKMNHIVPLLRSS